MKKIEMVDLRGQYLKIRNEIDFAIKKVIESAAFINGPEVRTFQDNLQKYLGTNHAITCGNGTDALQIALMALELEPGDEVITTPFTFIATAEAIALLNLKPVFADVCPRCFNIDVNEIEKAITKRTRVILPVHLFGQCANMEAIMNIAARNDLFVIEDAAQALGSEFTFSDGTVKKAGTIGHIGCTSFFPSKNLGCFGDGGAMFTSDGDLAGKLLSIRQHGSRVKYFHERTGVNSRLDTIQAAILDVKLNYLDAYNRERKRAAAYYDSALQGIGKVVLPKRFKQSTHIFHSYVIKTGAADRDPLREHLKSAGIPTMVYYPLPMHLQEGFVRYGYKSGEFPVAEALCSTVLSIPLHTELGNEQLEYICRSIRNYYE